MATLNDVLPVSYYAMVDAYHERVKTLRARQRERGLWPDESTELRNATRTIDACLIVESAMVDYLRNGESL